MKQYFPKFVFKYQLSLNTVNLHTKTGNMFVNNVQKQTFLLPTGVATGPAPRGVIVYISKNYRCR